MAYINHWVNDHEGSSFIDLFLASDVAYTNMAIQGNYEAWDQAIKISKKDAEEREEYKPKNMIKFPYEEQKS